MQLSSRAAGAIALNILLGVIVLPIVLARLWTRRVLQKTNGAEDILIFLATIATTGALVGCSLAICLFHYDEHTWQLSVPQLVRAGWILFLAETVYIILSGMIKIAILLFYFRLAPASVGRAFRWALYTVMGEVVVYKTIYILILCTSCFPLEAHWQRADPAWSKTHAYVCHTSDALNITAGSSISAVEDLVLALLPLVLIWNLSVPLRTKLGIWFLFSLSLGTSALGFVRAYLMWKAYYHGHHDYIYWLYWTWLLAMLEVACGLVCSSIPALKPFIAHFSLESRLRNLLRLRPKPAYSDSTSPFRTQSRMYGTQSRLYSRPRVDTDSLMFDGVASVISMAVVSNGRRDREQRESRSLETLKTVPTITEEEEESAGSDGDESKASSPEQAMAEVYGKDNMWINVRSSVTVIRGPVDEEAWT